MNELPERESTETAPPFIKNQAAFSSLFPGVIQDGTIDLHRLEEALGVKIEGLTDAKDRFGLMWAGKKKALEALQAPSLASLKPEPEKSIGWDNAENVFVEGDNLEVLKLLQNAYNDKVKLIYIDPPYNTGNDFVYNDDFSDPLQHYLEVTGQKDADGNRLVANTETSGRKHSNWLNMMYPRLALARNLLTQDGAIFVSIDDNEVHNLRLLMDEIFGSENFVACITWHKTYSTRNDAQEFSKSHEYLLVYKRSTWNRTLLPRSEKNNLLYKYDDGDGRGPYRTGDLTASRSSATETFEVTNPNTGQSFYPSSGLGWRHNKENLQKLIDENRIYWGKNGDGAPQLKRYLSEVQDGVIPTTIWGYEEVGHTDKAAKEVKDLIGAGIFDYPKPLDLLARVIQLGMGKDDLILDFFAGSGTTAHATILANAADGGNRKFLIVTLDEPTDAKSTAFAQGYKKVSDITLARINKAMEIVPGAKEKGLRTLKLAASNFKETQSLESGQLELFSESLEKDLNADAIASEILLQLGVSASEPWIKRDISGGSLIIAGGIFLVASKTLTSDFIDSILNERPSVVVFLEDAFASNDALKSNTYYAAKQLGILMRTF